MHRRNRLNENILKRIIDESIRRVINENRVVVFNGITYPKNGWCIILSGGSGSGKGYVLARQLPIDGKVIDVDKYKEYFVKMNGGYINGEKFDWSNEDHVSFAHFAVKNKHWKDKAKKNFFLSQSNNKERLQNIIFDITGSEPNKDVTKIALEAKGCGYNTMLVWVVSNRSEAIIRNLERKRTVKNVILHGLHNDIMLKMPPYLKSAQSTECIDDAWIIFSSTEDIRRPKLSDEEQKNAAIRLKRTNSGFQIDEQTMEKLVRYFGEVEANPLEPETYMANNDVLGKFAERVPKKITTPNWSDLSKPRTKIRYANRINRDKLPSKDLLRKNNL